jgi:hypothetical protein
MFKSPVILGLVGIFVLGWSVAAEAEDRNVQTLLYSCKQNTSSPDYSLCIGYVAGVGDLMDVNSTLIPEHPYMRPFAICGKPTYGAMVQAFVNWAEKHPEEWKDSTNFGVMLALLGTFPCK